MDRALKGKTKLKVLRPTCRQTDSVDEASYQSFPSAQLSPERCKDMKLVRNWNSMTVGDYFSMLPCAVLSRSPLSSGEIKRGHCLYRLTFI